MTVDGLQITPDVAERAGIIAYNRDQVARAEKRTFRVTDRTSFEALFGGPTPASGVVVTEESSMRIAAVFAAVRVLSESVASLPLKLYRRRDRSREAATAHPLHRVLHHQANELMTAFQLREVMMVHLCLWGNSYSEIQLNRRGDVVGLWPIHPARVTVDVDSGGPQPVVSYGIRLPKGEDITLRRDQVLHVAGLGLDGFTGKSPIRLAREALGISVAAERFGARFFQNDARPGVVLRHPAVLGDDGFARVKKSWESAHMGVDNAHRAAILEEGMDISTVGIPPQDAQFIETRKFQTSEVARIFRIPPHLIGDLEKATYSNIEHQGIEFVVHTLRPWLVRIEQAMRSQLLSTSEQEQFFAEHLVDGLLRGDAKSRYEAYAQGRNWGWLSANDIRDMENLNPIADGDIYLQPLNMVPAGSDPTKPTPGEGRSLEQRSIDTRALPPRFSGARALEPVYLDAFRRVVKRELAEIRKATGKYLAAGDTDGFRGWLLAFAEEHARWMQPRVLPVYQAMAEAMRAAAQEEIGGEVAPEDLEQFVIDYTEAYANRHAGSTRGQLEALLEQEDASAAVGVRLGEWEESRAEKDARRERQRSSNAVTKAAWALLGVSAVVWRNTGSETCPYCTSLSGKRVSITKYFVEAGESVADMVVTTRTGHPPLHDGCDCILMPGLGARKSLTPVEIRSLFDALINDRPSEHRHA